MKENISRRYKGVSRKKAEGVTYTPHALSDFVAEQIISNLGDRSGRSTLTVLDPAVGEGSLLISLLRKLQSLGFENVEVYGFDTNQESLKKAEAQLRFFFPLADLHLSALSFLRYTAELGDRLPLFAEGPSKKFDVIIANPPYVRTQVMGSTLAQNLSRQYGLAGRVDVYYAFFLGMGQLLSEDGVAGVIVSNRFMTTKSGGSLRKRLLESLSIKHIWDLGDTKLFDAAVLPAVIVFQKANGKRDDKAPIFTSIYETDESAIAHAKDPLDALQHTGAISVADGRHFRVARGSLHIQTDKSEVWRLRTDISDWWLKTVEANTWGTFADIGKIRVGIKTCADSVFIRSDWNTLPETQVPELLRPLTTHHIARRFRANSQSNTRKVVYPHETVSGQRVCADLNLYPKTKAYLTAHRDELSARSYLTKGGREWYEIWVPQDPSAWTHVKLVFRDISDKPTFWIDQEGTVVNGDCYWLKADSDGHQELLWLALAVSNSKFIEAFYDLRFNNKLYAGRRRFMTQYVAAFPLPDPETALAHEMIDLSKRIYDLTPGAEASHLEKRLDVAIWSAFGVDQSKKSLGSGI